MNLKDYKDGLIVEVKGNSYGTFKTYSLEPKGKGARTVKVLHSSTIGEINWSLALLKTFRLVDLKVKEGVKLTDETIYATRQWYADNAIACIDEAISGRVRVDDLDKFIIEQTSKVGEYLTGKWDHTLSFHQMAVVIQTGECHPILPKWTEK